VVLGLLVKPAGIRVALAIEVERLMEQLTEEELKQSLDPKEDEQATPSTNPDGGTEERAAAAPAEEAPAEEAEVKVKPRPKLSPEQMLIASLRATVLDKEEKLKSYITAYKQAMADVDREKERLAREREKVLDRERMDLCGKLLDVLDNLDRSRAGCDGASSVEELSQGLDMVAGQFLTALESVGVTRMTSLGEDFNHNLHEASGMIPIQGEQRDQEVVFEERAGYLFRDQLLRAARVVVAAAAD
jgi:molecular chaperone GrpE